MNSKHNNASTTIDIYEYNMCHMTKSVIGFEYLHIHSPKNSIQRIQSQKQTQRIFKKLLSLDKNPI